MNRAMFHLEVKVYENEMLTRGFSTPRRFQKIEWADLYCRYLQFLANKFYPIFKKYCAGEGASPEDKVAMNKTWFIYHCPIYLKQYLFWNEEIVTIYELCRVQYYFEHRNDVTDEIKIELTIVQKRAKY